MQAATHTPQQLWRTEFNRQATGKTMEVVIRHAQSLTRQVEARAGARDPMSADDRVQAAIVATLEGRLRWDPGQVDLATHLMNAVTGAFLHELRHARRFRYLSIDDDEQDTDELDRDVTERLAAARTAPDEGGILACFSEWSAQMRILAEADRPVLRILDAYGHGAIERHEVMTLTGMPARAYHNAHQRLVRLARKLPVEIQEAAIQAIA